MAQRHELLKQVIAMTDYTRVMYGGDRNAAQGQMVVTGPTQASSPEKRIGFCVQIRKNCGQFGSDMVFLRHPDGSLTTHENQAYFAMTADQELLARELFTDLPENEDYSEGYRCCDKVHEVGFLITHSASTPTPNQPFSLTIKSDHSDDTSPETFIAHIG